MSFLNTYALWFLLALPPVILLYLLKVKREEKKISSTLLWEQVINDLAANTPFQRLRKNLLMFLQLILLAAIAFSLLRPVVKGISKPSASTVIIIDNSGSMNAVEDGRSRLDIAKAEARKLLTGASNSGTNEFMILTAGRDVITVSSFTADIPAIESRISSIPPTDLPDNAQDAFSIANSAVKDTADASVYFVTDGCLKSDLPDIPALTGKLRIIRIGSPQPNMAITNLAAEEAGNAGEYEVYITIKNFSNDKGDTLLTIFDGESPVNAEEISFEPLESKSRSFIIKPQSEIIKCEIDSVDAIQSDNEAHLIVAKKKDTSILMVTEGNIFLSKAISSLEGIIVTTIPPAKFLISQCKDYEVIIFDSYVPPEMPSSRCIFISPSSDVGAVKFGGALESVIITDYEKDDPLLRFVALRDLYIVEALKIENPESLRAIASSKGVPLMGYFFIDNIQHLLIAFDLNRSEWVVRPSFPIFISNLIETTAAANKTISSVNLTVGSVVEINRRGENEKIEVVKPDGVSREFKSDGLSVKYFETERAGLYKFKIGTVQRLVAMNYFDEVESDTFHSKEMNSGSLKNIVSTSVRSVSREIWKYFVMGAFVIGMAEWICFHRKIQ